MDFNGEKKYEIELWSIQGIKVADISDLAKSRKYTLERNEAEQLEFTLDLDAFEAFCAGINTPPRNVLAPYQTEVKIKRNGQYLFGTQVVDCPIELGESARTITVKCTGYLNLFKDRYVTASYDQDDATQIAAALITATQAQANGSVGVTIGATQYLTGILRDRNYERDNVKSAIQNLTSLIDGNFDFKFTHDKKFETYGQLGALRSDMELAYGGDGSNIKTATIERSGANLYNYIYGLGSGFGADQLVSDPVDSGDEVSQLAYYRREKIEQFNSVSVQETLDQNTQARLEMYKELLEIPKITITGNEITGSFIDIGDRIPVYIREHAFVDNVFGLYRVEKMTVDIDDNDFENNIQLYFDNLGVDQNEQA